jgi:hypothetical protein
MAWIRERNIPTERSWIPIEHKTLISLNPIIIALFEKQ